MRISDWSSDVCSSDLRWQPTALAEVGLRRAVVLEEPSLDVLGHEPEGCLCAATASLVPAGNLATRPRDSGRSVVTLRSEERRVGNVCVSSCRSRSSPYHLNHTSLPGG